MKRSAYPKRSGQKYVRRLTPGTEHMARDVQCLQCKATFPDYMRYCPECGSEERTGITEVNPYAHMPMDSFLQGCGHVFWLTGVVAFLMLIWQTNDMDKATGLLIFYGAICVLVSGVILSVAYFALSELLRRIIRIQRRLRTFHETYRRAQPQKRQYSIPRSMPHKRALKRAMQK